VPGKGAVFWNAKDGCWPAISVDGTTCLIVGLGGDQEEALLKYKKVMDVIRKNCLMALNSADDIITAATIGSEITGDVYNSNKTWFEENARSLMSEDNYHFLEGRGKAHSAVFIPEESSIVSCEQ
jgi:hypothetical protein